MTTTSHKVAVLQQEGLITRPQNNQTQINLVFIKHTRVEADADVDLCWSTCTEMSNNYFDAGPEQCTCLRAAAPPGGQAPAG